MEMLSTLQGQTNAELYVLFGWFFFFNISAQYEENPIGVFWLGNTIFSSVSSLKIKARIIANQHFSAINAQCVLTFVCLFHKLLI